MATASKPSMGVAPPEGGDCSWLAAGRLFLSLRFLLSQEAEDATPFPGARFTRGGLHLHQSRRRAPQRWCYPNLGNCSTKLQVPSHHRHQNLGGVQRDIRRPWNHRRFQPQQCQCSRQQSLGGVQLHVGRAWTHWGLQPRQRQRCRPFAASSSPHLLEALLRLDYSCCPGIAGRRYPSGSHLTMCGQNPRVGVMQWSTPKQTLGKERKLKLHSERVSSYNNFTWDWDLACADALRRILFLYLNSEEHRLYIHEGIQKHFGTILLTLPQTIVCIYLLPVSLIECWKTAMLSIYFQGIWWSFWKMTVI